MCVLIVGGNERMVCQYKDVCKNYGCEAKVFIDDKGALKKKMGGPDLVVLFTSTVSHRMRDIVTKEAKRNNIPIVHTRTSSAAALNQALCRHLWGA